MCVVPYASVVLLLSPFCHGTECHSCGGQIGPPDCHGKRLRDRQRCFLFPHDCSGHVMILVDLRTGGGCNPKDPSSTID